MKFLLVMLNVLLVSMAERAYHSKALKEFSIYLEGYISSPAQSWQLYLFLLAVTSFITIFACTKACKLKRARDSILILGYAVVHFLFLCFYITMINREAFDLLSYAFFDAAFSLCNFILAYEFLMVLSGLRDGIIFVRNRYSYADIGRYLDRAFNYFVAGSACRNN